MHASTFQYLKPTEAQMADMEQARTAFAKCAEEITRVLPDGPDKTYVLRKLRECAMWSNVSITRDANGTPRV